MPEADVFQAPQGKTFHAEPLLQAVTEAFVGNGVLADGEADVTADSNTNMGITVSAANTGIAFKGSVYTPSSASFTLSDGPTSTTNGQDDRRVDLVYFDESAGSYATTEGAADPNPTPPSVPSDALMLAICLIPHEATDLADANILNWRARPSSGTQGGSTGVGAGAQEVEFDQGLHVGFDPGDDVVESSSPKGFTYTANDGRDVHEETDVDISNSSGASATEDVTVELYDGSSTSGTLLVDETKSVTVGDGNSKTVTFITTDKNLDGGDYHINITTSGSDLSIDKTTEKTQGLVWSYTETDSGTLELTNRYTGTVVQSIDPISDEITWPNGAVDQSEIADGAVATAKLADDAATAAKIAADAVGATQIADGAVDSARIAALASGIGSVTNPGTFGALFNLPVDSNSSDGTTHSFTFDIDGNSVIEVRGDATGGGGVDTLELRLQQKANVNGNDVEDSGTTIWSSSNGHVPRGSVETDVSQTGAKTSNYTTSGDGSDESIPVDTANSGGAVTITLASGDAVSGRRIRVFDSGSNANNNNISVATGSGSLNGPASTTISTADGYREYESDGTDWYEVAAN